MHGGDGIDLMWGGPGGDTMYGDAGGPITICVVGTIQLGNLMWGNNLNDVMYGGVDSDLMWGNRDVDTMFGGPGPIDLMWGNDDGDLMHGEDGVDLMWGNRGVDTMFGGDGLIDLMWGNDDIDTMFGNNGVDLMWGNDDNDTMFGNDGVDLMWGNRGVDTMFGGPGPIDLMWGNDDDPMHGEDGVDLMWGNRCEDTMFGGSGLLDLMWGNDDDDTMSGEVGVDLMWGNSGDDTMNGNADPDLIFGNYGDDLIHGNDGLDVLSGNRGDDRMFGDIGVDFMLGNQGRDHMEGGDDFDLMFGNSDSDTMFGDGGTDLMFGNTGGDCMHGGLNTDIMAGNSGDDEVNGDGGVDFVLGNSGNDVLHGDGDSDMLFGNDDNDKVFGDGGTDFAFGNSGDDKVYGGADPDLVGGNRGNDTLFGDGAADMIVGNDDNDRAYGGLGVDFVFGNSDDDTLFGDDGGDYIFGNQHNDNLHGGMGDDRMFGNRGNDTMFGDDGDDKMYGNRGNDTMLGGNDKDGVYGNRGNDPVLDGGGQLDRVCGGLGTDTRYECTSVGQDTFCLIDIFDPKIPNCSSFSKPDTDCSAEIHGTKWNDVSANGVRDPGDPGLGGVTINLSGTQSGATTTMFDNSIICEEGIGQYSFTGLCPGTYTVTEVVPTGMFQTFPTSGVYGPFTLGPGEIATGKDFGNADKCHPDPTSGTGCTTDCPGSCLCVGGDRSGLRCACIDAECAPHGTCLLISANQCVPVCARVYEIDDPPLPTVIDCDCLPPAAPGTPCQIDISAPDPVCGGDCPPGQECAKTRTQGQGFDIDVCCRCEVKCVSPLQQVLLHDCPDPEQNLTPTVLAVNRTCGGAPDGAPCVTNAECPQANCMYSASVVQEECIDPSDCHVGNDPATGPYCIGGCADDQECQLDVSGNQYRCDCVAGRCAATADSTGCEPVTCPDPSHICKATQLAYDPSTGQTTLSQCDCVDPNECHLEIDPVLGPHCVGTCAEDQVCDLVELNGVLFCGCVEDCHPGCVNYDPATQITLATATDCSCALANECHATVPEPGGGQPECVNGCPSGETCAQTETVNTDGTIEICCRCAPEPLPTVSEWGLVILTLVLLIGAKIYFARRQTARA